VILNSLCNTCFQPFQVLIEMSDVNLIRQIAVEDGKLAPCPRLCGGFINMQGDDTIEQMANDPRLKAPMQITGKELYKAVNGAGLPDEVPQSKETIEALLKANKVVGTKLEELNGKFYIHEVLLENGLTLHLAAGLRGAHVLKVTKELR
jgi:hypothetical protein